MNDATRYLADRHVCGCFRFTLVVLASAYVEEGRGRKGKRAVLQGESRWAAIEFSRRVSYNSAGPVRFLASVDTSRPDSRVQILLSTDRVKTRGHVFANERVSFPRLRPLSSKRSAIGLTRFAKIERVMLFYLPIYNEFLASFSHCNFFYG